ncbi:hypothetical protein ACTG9Q_10975 [Actinokineospora sp. 24-640]
MSHRPGFSGTDGIGCTWCLASLYEPTWRCVRSWTLPSSGSASSCSIASGPAPRDAAPAAGPSHTDSMSAVSFRISADSSPYCVMASLTWRADSASPSPPVPLTKFS